MTNKAETTRIKITLNAAARAEAIAMRNLRGIPTPDDFEGPDFDNVVLVQVSQGFLHVELETGVTYSYNSNSVARIANYPKPKSE